MPRPRSPRRNSVSDDDDFDPYYNDNRSRRGGSPRQNLARRRDSVSSGQSRSRPPQDAYDRPRGKYDDYDDYRPRRSSTTGRGSDRARSADGYGRPSADTDRGRGRDRYYPPSASRAGGGSGKPRAPSSSSSSSSRKPQRPGPGERKRSSSTSAILSSATRYGLEAGAIAAMKLRNDPSPWIGAKGTKVVASALGAALLDTFIEHRHPNVKGGVRHTAMRQVAQTAVSKIVQPLASGTRFGQ